MILEKSIGPLENMFLDHLMLTRMNLESKYCFHSPSLATTVTLENDKPLSYFSHLNLKDLWH